MCVCEVSECDGQQLSPTHTSLCVNGGTPLQNHHSRRRGAVGGEYKHSDTRTHTETLAASSQIDVMVSMDGWRCRQTRPDASE